MIIIVEEKEVKEAVRWYLQERGLIIEASDLQTQYEPCGNSPEDGADFIGYKVSIGDSLQG